jgi:DNA polymerase-3 subunit epsilon
MPRSTVFTAIDFETANRQRSSVCSVGITVVKDGRIVDEFHSLIRPSPDYFESHNVRVHGISERVVRDAPSFADLWPSLKRRLQGDLVAHQASFDMSCLRAILDLIGEDYPEIAYYCTVEAAKSVWPALDCFRLPYLTERLGIALAKHHDAQQDARACAFLVDKILNALDVSTLCELEELKGLSPGKLFPGGYRPCARRRDGFS